MQEVEQAIASARLDKVKAEREKAVAKGKGSKKTLNVGRSGTSAGLDDYIFNEALDDDGDFM